MDKSRQIIDQITAEQSIDNSGLIVIDYDPAALLKTVDEFETRDIKFRKKFAENCQNVIGLIEPRKMEQFLQKVFKDNTDVKNAYGNSIAFLSEKCKEVGQYELVWTSLKGFAQQKQLDLKQKSLKLVKPWCQNCTIQKIIELGDQQSQGDEDSKIFTVELFAVAAQFAKEAVLEDRICNTILRIGKEEKVRLVRAVVMSFKEVSLYCSAQFVDKRIAPYLFRHCADANWNVRKACVESLAYIAERASKPLREVECTNHFLKFLQDESQWVRLQSFVHLGRFIGHLDQCEIKQDLLNYFIKAVDLMNGEPEVAKSCAYYFSYVFKAVPFEKQTLMMRLLQRLTKFQNYEVRRPLVSGLHQIGRLIGKQNTKKNLLPFLEQVLKSNEVQLKVAAVKYLSQFIELFDKEYRQNFIDVFPILQSDSLAWRTRFQVVSQFSSLGIAFGPELAHKYLVPVVFKLCNDQTHEVRKAASQNVFQLFNLFVKHKPFADELLLYIKRFADSTKSVHKISFLDILQGLALNEVETVEENLIEQLKLVLGSRVSSIRVRAGQLLAVLLRDKNRLLQHPTLEAEWRQLSADPLVKEAWLI